MAHLPLGATFSRPLRKLAHISGGLPLLVFPLFVDGLPERVVAYLLGSLYLVFFLLVAAFPRPVARIFHRLVKPGEAEQGLRGASAYFFVLSADLLILAPLVGLKPAALAGLMLTFGDGFSALVGRRESPTWPWNPSKTIWGSVGFALSTFLAWLIFLGLAGHPLEGRLALISLTAAVVGALLESLPLEDVLDDNLVVGLGGMLIAILAVGVI